MKKTGIPKPQLFRFEESLWFLDRNYDDCMHIIEDGVLYKAIHIDGRNITFSLRDAGDELLLELTGPADDDAALRETVRYIGDWLDLDRRLDPFYILLRRNKATAYMADAYAGLRMVGIPDMYEALSWSIIGQQINLSFAYTLKRRLVTQYGHTVDGDGRVLHLFPDPAVVREIPAEAWRDMQFSRSKAEYLTGISGMFLRGGLSKTKLQQCSTHEERLKQLTAVKGIGTWTANYVLMKSLKEMQAVPHGDAGLLNALLQHELIRDKQDMNGINTLFGAFKGWEAYLVFYLWRSLSTAPFQER